MHRCSGKSDGWRYPTIGLVHTEAGDHSPMVEALNIQETEGECDAKVLDDHGSESY